jgi:hypothetical protein
MARLDNDENDRIDVEDSTLFSVLIKQKRRAARRIKRVQDTLGNIYESPKDIVKTFVTYRRK